MVLTQQERRILETLLARDREAQAVKQQENRKAAIQSMMQKGKDAVNQAASKAVNKLNAMDAKLDQKLAAAKSSAFEKMNSMKTALAEKAQVAKQAIAAKTASVAMQAMQVKKAIEMQQAQKAQQAQAQRLQLAQKQQQAQKQYQAQRMNAAKSNTLKPNADRIRAQFQQSIQAQKNQQQGKAVSQQHALKMINSFQKLDALKRPNQADQKARMEAAAKQQSQKIAQSTAVKALDRKPEELQKAKQQAPAQEQQRKPLSMNALQDVVKRGTVMPDPALRQMIQKSTADFDKRADQLAKKIPELQNKLSDVKDKAGQAIASQKQKNEQVTKDREAIYKDQHQFLSRKIDENQSRQDYRARQAAEAERNKPKWRQSGELQYSEDNSAYRKKNANGEMDYYRQNQAGDYEFDHQRTSKVKAEAPIYALREKREQEAIRADEKEMSELLTERKLLEHSHKLALEQDKVRDKELQSAEEKLRSTESASKVDKAASAEAPRNVQETKAEHARKQAELQQQGPKQGSKQDLMEQQERNKKTDPKQAFQEQQKDPKQDQQKGQVDAQQKPKEGKPEANQDPQQAYANKVVEGAQKFSSTKQGQEGPQLNQAQEQKAEKGEKSQAKQENTQEWDASKRTRCTEQSGKPEENLKKDAPSNVSAQKEQAKPAPVIGEDEFSPFKKKR